VSARPVAAWKTQDFDGLLRLALRAQPRSTIYEMTCEACAFLEFNVRVGCSALVGLLLPERAFFHSIFGKPKTFQRVALWRNLRGQRRMHREIKSCG
jgi:hypothetical protein